MKPVFRDHDLTPSAAVTCAVAYPALWGPRGVRCGPGKRWADSSVRKHVFRMSRVPHVTCRALRPGYIRVTYASKDPAL